jgi:hypothetical protein
MRISGRLVDILKSGERGVKSKVTFRVLYIAEIMKRSGLVKSLMLLILVDVVRFH